MKYTPLFIGLGAVVGLGLTSFVSTDANAQGWQPKKPVEFVIMAGKGGGADRLARFIQGIIAKNKFASKPFVPINKGGGSGAEALRYLKDKAGDPHVIMATLNSYYTTPLRQPGLGVDISTFTPIARMHPMQRPFAEIDPVHRSTTVLPPSLHPDVARFEIGIRRRLLHAPASREWLANSRRGLCLPRTMTQANQHSDPCGSPRSRRPVHRRRIHYATMSRDSSHARDCKTVSHRQVAM